jgi:hypothetical protein
VKRPVFMLFAAILLLALLPGSAMAIAMPGALDQANDPDLTPGHSIGTPGDIAQTFTVGQTGLLTHVQLYFDGNGTIGITIQTTSGGLPTGSMIGGGVQTFAGPTGWVDFPIFVPAPVTAGTKYAIVFNSGETAAAEGSGDTYSGGQALIVSSGWKTMQDYLPGYALYDFAFKTYVDPQTTALQWDKTQIIGGVATSLKLTETFVFPTFMVPSIEAVQPAPALLGKWSVQSVALPAWFTPATVACSTQILPTDCVLANVAPGGSMPVTPDGNPITVTLTGTAAPALAAVGTNGTGTAEGCAAYPIVDIVTPSQLPGGTCVSDDAVVAVVAVPTTPPPATPPPTATGGSSSPSEPGLALWLLPALLMGLLGGAFYFGNRNRRLTR